MRNSKLIPWNVWLVWVNLQPFSPLLHCHMLLPPCCPPDSTVYCAKANASPRYGIKASGGIIRYITHVSSSLLYPFTPSFQLLLWTSCLFFILYLCQAITLMGIQFPPFFFCSAANNVWLRNFRFENFQPSWKFILPICELPKLCARCWFADE